jgi:hypothetical protein
MLDQAREPTKSGEAPAVAKGSVSAPAQLRFVLEDVNLKPVPAISGELASRAENSTEQTNSAARLATEDGSEKAFFLDIVKNAPAQYEKIQRGIKLYRRYAREQGLTVTDEDIDPREFCAWLFTIKSGVSESAWRTYCNAAKARIQSVPHDSLDEAIAMLEADVGNAGEARSVQHGRRVGHAPAERAQRFAVADFKAVIQTLPTFSRSPAVPWLTDWMTAAVDTGLNPSEWARSRIEARQAPNGPTPSQKFLHVDYRGQDENPERTLDISEFSAAALAAVERMVTRSAEWGLEQKFETRQSRCAQLLYEVCAVLFPRQKLRYSLYSLHHQFVANMAEIYETAQVAALIGRIVEKRARAHYRKHRIAWPKSQITEVPAPMPNQVSRMRKRLQGSEERLAMQSLRRAFKVRRKRR